MTRKPSQECPMVVLRRAKFCTVRSCLWPGEAPQNKGHTSMKASAGGMAQLEWKLSHWAVNGGIITRCFCLVMQARQRPLMVNSVAEAQYHDISQSLHTHLAFHWNKGHLPLGRVWPWVAWLRDTFLSAYMLSSSGWMAVIETGSLPY